MTFPVFSAGTSAYNLQRSLRFRSSATAYLNRTPASASNRKTWTWSGWVKRGVMGSSSSGFLFTTRGNATDAEYFRIIFTTDTIRVTAFNDSALSLITTAVYRDPSAWYHIVFALDTTQATASNRMKLYVNGVQVTAFSSVNYPAQNADFGINSAIEHGIGFLPINVTGTYFDGYMAEVNFIDGQALTPSSFGSTNAVTGVWQPAKYTGTYGTNGFYLPFTNTTSTTTLGNDFSGNSNNWTTNNISLTSGVTYDSMTDVPTLTSPTAGNYCVLNPLATGSYLTLSNGNLTVTGNTAANSAVTLSTIAVTSGLFYFENTITTVGAISYIGFARVNSGYSDLNNAENFTNINNYGGVVRNGGSVLGFGKTTSSTTSFTTGDVIGLALDMTNGAVYVSKNNTWLNSGVPTSGSSKTGALFVWTAGTETICPMGGGYNGSVNNFNFGQRPFTYTPPSGFVALNTFNLPSSTIPAGNKFMDILLYTGTAPTPQTVTGLNFQTDFSWVKTRGYNTEHVLSNVIGGPAFTLSSNTTAAEYNGGTSNITAFNSNGITVGTADRVNRSGVGLVAWQWKANGAGVTNTSGSITSTVSANTTSGFSVVTYTGNATSGATIGHGLGVTPSMVIIKSRSAVGSWSVYHQTVGTDNYLLLNSTAASGAASGWISVSSSTIGNPTYYSTSINDSGVTYIAYCFTPIAGFSAFGSYTGNGSTDGPFVYTGFRPRWIMFKRTNSTGNWVIFDTARGTYNQTPNGLFPDLSDAEDSSSIFDLLSNGFKARSSGSAYNVNGGAYIYAAFAENPFKNALAR